MYMFMNPEDGNLHRPTKTIKKRQQYCMNKNASTAEDTHMTGLSVSPFEENLKNMNAK